MGQESYILLTIHIGNYLKTIINTICYLINWSHIYWIFRLYLILRHLLKLYLMNASILNIIEISITLQINSLHLNWKSSKRICKQHTSTYFVISVPLFENILSSYVGPKIIFELCCVGVWSPFSVIAISMIKPRS